MARTKKVKEVKVSDPVVETKTEPAVKEKKTVKKTKAVKAAKAPEKAKAVEEPKANKEEKCHCDCCSVANIQDDDKNIPIYNQLYDTVLRAEAQNASHKASMMKILSEMQSYQTAFQNFERNFKFDKKSVNMELVESLLKRLKIQTELLNCQIMALDMFLHADAVVLGDMACPDR